ncbi:MAG: hypothetical protein LCH93_13600 [Proteobacteria bacterium]|nr:hypothetical protein [Pseudomonadota bacterium]
MKKFNLLVRESSGHPWRVYGQLLKGASRKDCKQCIAHLPPKFDWVLVKTVERGWSEEPRPARRKEGRS